jgi:hypothetical protein
LQIEEVLMRLVIRAALCVLAVTACAESEPITDETERVRADPVDPALYGSSSGADKPAARVVPPASGTGDEALAAGGVMGGQWFASKVEGDPAALFGLPETEAEFVVRCAGDELVFSRGIRMRDGPASMTLMAAGKFRTIEATSSADPLPDITGRLEATDEFVTVLAETEDPIMVRIEDGPSLRMPPSRHLRDVIAGCRG